MIMVRFLAMRRASSRMVSAGMPQIALAHSRRLRCAVVLAIQITFELVESDGVVLQECFVVQLLRVERVHDAEHHRDVRALTDGKPLGVQIAGRFVADRVDHDDRRLFLAQRRQPGISAEIRHVPRHLQRVHGIRAPQDDQLGVANDHRPHGLLLVDLDRAHDVRHDHLRRARRVVTGRCDETASHREHPVQQDTRVVQRADALPSIGPPEDACRPVLGAHAAQLLRHEIQGVLPTHLHPLVPAAQRAIGSLLLGQEAFADVRMLHPGRRIHEARERLDQRVGWRRDQRHGVDETSFLDHRPEGTPVARVHDAVHGHAVRGRRERIRSLVRLSQHGGCQQACGGGARACDEVLQQATARKLESLDQLRRRAWWLLDSLLGGSHVAAVLLRVLRQ